jgi:dihydroxyacetone kinase
VLWGEALEAAGKTIGDTAERYDASCIAAAVHAACDRMLTLGGAHRGDKTMLDVLIPFSEALEHAASEGEDLAEAWASSSRVADQAAQDTAQLMPKVGRARPAAERSLGTPDAGAVSMALCIRTVMESGAR